MCVCVCVCVCRAEGRSLHNLYLKSKPPQSFFESRILQEIYFLNRSFLSQGDKVTQFQSNFQTFVQSFFINSLEMDIEMYRKAPAIKKKNTSYFIQKKRHPYFRMPFHYKLKTNESPNYCPLMYGSPHFIALLDIEGLIEFFQIR